MLLIKTYITYSVLWYHFHHLIKMLQGIASIILSTIWFVRYISFVYNLKRNIRLLIICCILMHEYLITPIIFCGT